MHLVGSHGSEFDVGFVERSPPSWPRLRTRLQRALRGDRRRQAAGVTLERKPASVAVHLRRADAGTSPSGHAEAVRTGPATWHGVHVTEGKEVIELSVVATHKGTALDQLRTQLGASAVLFLGDDVTDENAFANLHGPDLGIKIGPGDTAGALPGRRRRRGRHARWRCCWRPGAHWLLRRAGGADRAALDAGQRPHRRPAHARRQGHLAVPPRARTRRRSSPTCSAAARPATSAVAPERGGTAAGPALPAGHDDRGDPLVRAAVTDYLRDHAGGRRHRRLDLVRVLTGTGRAAVEFAPRPEFGQVPVQLQPLGDGLLVLGSNEPVALYSPGVDWEVIDDGGHETATPMSTSPPPAGRSLLELRFGTRQPRHHRAPIRERQPPPSSRLDGLGGRRCGCRRRLERDLVAAQRADAARPVPRADTARSSPRRPPRCPRSSAASATGTTATAGCATRR